LAVSPTPISAGQSATLSWTTAGAASIAIRPSIGSVAASGSITVSASATTTYTLVAEGAGGAVLSSATLSVGAGTGDGTPFGGTPWPIPGSVEAENFNECGEGVAYHYNSAGNNGGAYRSTDVDIEATSDSGGGFDVGWMTAGEWLNYTVSVAQSGS